MVAAGQQDKSDKQPARKDNGLWTEKVETNALFEKYYKDLGICKNEDEWQSFLQHLREPLPTNFRFTGSRSTAFELRDLMKKIHKSLNSNAEGFDEEDSLQASF